MWRPLVRARHESAVLVAIGRWNYSAEAGNIGPGRRIDESIAKIGNVWLGPLPFNLPAKGV